MWWSLVFVSPATDRMRSAAARVYSIEPAGPVGRWGQSNARGCHGIDAQFVSSSVSSRR